MMGLYEIKKELLELSIKSNDYITLGNLGYKNGVLTYFDIGGCYADEPNIPQQIHLAPRCHDDRVVLLITNANVHRQ